MSATTSKRLRDRSPTHTGRAARCCAGRAPHGDVPTSWRAPPRSSPPSSSPARSSPRAVPSRARLDKESALPGVTLRTAKADDAPALDATPPARHRSGAALRPGTRLERGRDLGQPRGQRPGDAVPADPLRGSRGCGGVDEVVHRHGGRREEDPQRQGQAGDHDAHDRHRGSGQRRRVRGALRRRGAGTGRLRGLPRVVRRLPGLPLPAGVDRCRLACGRRGDGADPAHVGQARPAGSPSASPAPGG